jgi:hypothetical protein
MVGWLKNFVQTRARPAASLIKGYTIHMLARRAPFQLAQDFELRRATYGKEMAKRGHLTLISSLIARRAQKPGCGKMTVSTSRRHTRDLPWLRLPEDFKRCYNLYNNNTAAANRFSIDKRKINFADISSNKGPKQRKHIAKTCS